MSFPLLILLIILGFTLVSAFNIFILFVIRKLSIGQYLQRTNSIVIISLLSFLIVTNLVQESFGYKIGFALGHLGGTLVVIYIITELLFTIFKNKNQYYTKELKLFSAIFTSLIFAIYNSSNF